MKSTKSIYWIAVLLLLWSCHKEIKPTMNTYDYTAAWQRVKVATEEGRPKDAIALTQDIIRQASQDRSTVDLVRGVTSIPWLKGQIDMDDYLLSIYEIEASLDDYDATTTALLISYLADAYYQHYSQNRWQIGQRTHLADEQPDDIKEWSSINYYRHIHALYQQALAEQQVLDVPVSDYQILLGEHTDNGLAVAPTMYLAVAQKAMEFYQSASDMVVSNLSSLQLTDPVFYAESKAFVAYDTDSNQPDIIREQVRVYQQVEQYAASRSYALPLEYAMLQRVGYMYQHASMPDNDKHYLLALGRMADSSQALIAAEATYLTAAYYRSSGDLVKAHQLATAIVRTTSSQLPAYTSATNLIAQIQRQEIQVQAEEEIAVATQTALSIEYRNLDKVYLQLYKASYEQSQQIEQMERDSIGGAIRRLELARSWTVDLPRQDDFQQHRYESLLDSMPQGLYYLLAAPTSDSENSTGLHFAKIEVTDISIRHLRLPKKHHLMVIHRVTGLPLIGAKVELYTNFYDRTTRTNIKRWQKPIYTDEAGLVDLPTSSRNWGVQVTLAGYTYRLDRGVHYFQSSSRDETAILTILTDRAIYRPSQTVYYKVLAIAAKAKDKTAMANKSVVIEVRDSNDKVVHTSTDKTNMYGSVSGSIVLPGGGLPGQYRLSAQLIDGISRSTTIRVEEYKRPRFEVTLHQPTASKTLGDTITISGMAKSLAGVSLSDATVKYSVNRVQYRPWWDYRRSYVPNVPDKVIAIGEKVADLSGDFTFDFVASYDPYGEANYYRYQVQVDVTDTNGETRSASAVYSLSRQAIQLGVQVDKEYALDSLKEIRISATNFAGVDQPVSGRLIISRLDEPDYYHKQRYWSAPEQSQITDYKAVGLSPVGQTDYSDWPLAEQVAQYYFDLSSSSTVEIDRIADGAYRIEILSADADTITTYTTITDYSAARSSKTSMLSHHLAADSYQPGALATLHISSTVEAEVFCIIERGNGIEQQWHSTAVKPVTISLPITEADRGGIPYTILMVKDNRQYETRGVIEVPFTNKELNISLVTYRDKVLPGSQESWTLKVTGDKGDQVNAEVLAAMYDASLDQFATHAWRADYYHRRRHAVNSQAYGYGSVQLGPLYYNWNQPSYQPASPIITPYLQWSNAPTADRLLLRGSRNSKTTHYTDGISTSPAPLEYAAMSADSDSEDRQMVQSETPPATADKIDAAGNSPLDNTASPPIKIRSDFDETVFFYPHLSTDAEGNVLFTFTMKEALTRWRLMLLAHTVDIKVGYAEQAVITQKDLMIMGNNPRFLRAGDQIVLTGKVSNLTADTISGSAELRLIDALSGQPLPFLAGDASRTLTLSPVTNKVLSWTIDIPRDHVSPIIYRLVARTTEHSDGEEHLLSTVTNRKLVTETMPMYVPADTTIEFSMTGLAESDSPTLKHHAYTVEYTSQPIWYVLQALPYLVPRPQETTDHIAERLYAYAVGQYLVNLSPRVKQVFDQWASSDSDALLSNLHKNPELKNTILTETPWVAAAASESEQKRLIALFFDINKMANDQASAMQKLQQRQVANGGWPWCASDRDNAYITQRILLQMGRLRDLGITSVLSGLETELNRAQVYNDEQIAAYYQRLIKQQSWDPSRNHLSSIAVQYIYSQMLYDRTSQGVGSAAYTYFVEQAQKYWLSRSYMEQAMIAQHALWSGQEEVARQITTSLKQYSIVKDELGMYWQDQGYHWYQAPVERQAEMIRLFSKVSDKTTVQQLALHLLQLKKTTAWPTSAGTTAAVHAILTADFTGEGIATSDWLSDTAPVQVLIDGEDALAPSQEAGTLYSKRRYTAVGRRLADIKVTNPNKSVSWGAAYWQYWEDLDRITGVDDNPLKIDKEYYLKVNTEEGSVLQKVQPQQQLQMGDRLVTRLVISTDRPMSFVHLQDMRPAGVEPIDVLSSYRYHDGLGFYQASRDLSTDFYIAHLPEGTFVLEYDVFVSHEGDFSTGISTLQCYYAPEYSSHSAGSRIVVE